MSEVVLTIRMEKALREQLGDLSKANNNSINREVVELVKKAVKRLPKRNTDKEV